MTSDSLVHRVFLTPLAGRAGRFSVTYGGETLVASARDPGTDACRALLARGITGRLVTRWVGSDHDAMSMDIAAISTRRVEESDRHGLRVVAFRAFDPASLDKSGLRRTGDRQRAEALFKPPTTANDVSAAGA